MQVHKRFYDVCQGRSEQVVPGPRCVAIPEVYGLWPLPPPEIRVKSYLTEGVAGTFWLKDGGPKFSVCGRELQPDGPGWDHQLCATHWSVSPDNPDRKYKLADTVYQESLAVLGSRIEQRAQREAEEARRDARFLRGGGAGRKRTRSASAAGGAAAPRGPVVSPYPAQDPRFLNKLREMIYGKEKD